VLGATTHWERLIVLAPVFIVGAGLVVGTLILLGRAFADSYRGSDHKRLLLFGLIALVGVVVLLTYLGISLPREE
jgi:hypothetical protein